VNDRELQQLSVLPIASVREVMRAIDLAGSGIALVVDAERHLLGTITDGDVRRAILAGVDLGGSVSELLVRKAGTVHSTAITGTASMTTEELKTLMLKKGLRHIPIVGADNRVVDLARLDDLVPAAALDVHAVIMAGGFGTRMLPLTAETPKPMLLVGGKPLMERTLEQLRQAGIRRVTVTTHHKPEKIRDYFGDGRAFGVELQYIHETEPLGTGGSLGLIPVPAQPLLVINGDILTQVDFRAMLLQHVEHAAEMTIAVRRYGVKVAYGVVECEGARVCALKEKPEMRFLVNAGIYLLEPSVYDVIPRGKRFDMTDLVQWLLDAGRGVVSFPVIEYWVDIGQPADYQRAQDDANREGWEA